MPKLFTKFVNFFRPLQSVGKTPTLDADYDTSTAMGALLNAANNIGFGGKRNVTEAQHRSNMETIELAKLQQEREIHNNNLKAQHRGLMVTLIATLIALFSSLSALYITIERSPVAPPTVNVTTPKVDVKPNINVVVPEARTENEPPQQ